MDQLRYVDLDIGEYRIRLVETENNMERQVLTLDIEYGDDDFKHRAWVGTLSGHAPGRSRKGSYP